MPTITIGSDNYEAYVEVADVDSYANGSLNATAWDDLTEDDKGRAVVTATRWIDSQCWQGEKADPVQELAWPRIINGETVDVEPKIALATELLSILTAANPELPDQMTGNVAVAADGGTKRLKAGSVEIEYFRKLNFTVYGNGTVAPFPQSVMSLIGAYLCSALGRAGGNAGSQSFGTCAESTVGRRGRFSFAGPI